MQLRVCWVSLQTPAARISQHGRLLSMISPPPWETSTVSVVLLLPSRPFPILGLSFSPVKWNKRVKFSHFTPVISIPNPPSLPWLILVVQGFHPQNSMPQSLPTITSFSVRPQVNIAELYTPFYFLVEYSNFFFIFPKLLVTYYMWIFLKICVAVKKIFMDFQSKLSDA